MLLDYFNYLFDLLTRNKEMFVNMIYVRHGFFQLQEVANIFCQLLILKKNTVV